MRFFLRRTNCCKIISQVDFFLFLSQLQEAFAKGLLKPGMNVLLDKPKKLVNSVVSLEFITNVEFNIFQLFNFLLQQHKAAAQVVLSGKSYNKEELYKHVVVFMDCFCVILSFRRVWSSALQTSVKIFPGWRGWTWRTRQLRTSCRKWKEKLLMWPMETSV